MKYYVSNATIYLNNRPGYQLLGPSGNTFTEVPRSSIHICYIDNSYQIYFDNNHFNTLLDDLISYNVNHGTLNSENYYFCYCLIAYDETLNKANKNIYAIFFDGNGVIKCYKEFTKTVNNIEFQIGNWHSYLDKMTELPDNILQFFIGELPPAQPDDSSEEEPDDSSMEDDSSIDDSSADEPDDSSDDIIEDYDDHTEPVNGYLNPPTTGGKGKGIKYYVLSPSQAKRYFNSYNDNPVREVLSYIEEYDKDNKLIDTYKPTDYLTDWTLNANSDIAFFGKMNCYSLEVSLINIDGNMHSPEVGNYFKVYIGCRCYTKDNLEYDIYTNYPRMWIYETTISDVTKKQNITCYDDIAFIRWGNKTFKDIDHTLDLGSTLNAILALYGINSTKSADLITNHTEWANSEISARENYEDDTPLIDVLEDWLEINGCNAYMDYKNRFHLVRYENTQTSFNSYYNSMIFDSAIGTKRTVSGISNVTTLGDNILYGTDTNTVVNIIDNGLIDIHENKDGIINWLLNKVENTELYNIEITSRCYMELQPFDICIFSTEDETYRFMHANYTIAYNGGLIESLDWQYPDQEVYDFNVYGLDTTIRKTVAKVDKVNQEITLAIEKSDDASSKVTQLVLDLDGIKSDVQDATTQVNNQTETIQNIVNQSSLWQTADQVQALVKQEISTAEPGDLVNSKLSQLQIDLDGIHSLVESYQVQQTSLNDSQNADIQSLRQKSEMSQTAEDVKILISESIRSNEVDEVTTSTGFKFNKDGLTISKTDSNITTKIDENGMDISVGSQTQLNVDNNGVDAINITSHKYLQVAHSRFEHFKRGTDNHRTAIFFWEGDDL